MTQTVAAIAAAVGLYLLGRSIAAIQAIAGSPLTGDSVPAQAARWIVDALSVLLPRLDAARIGQAIAALRGVRDNDKTVYICGNGGSASIASQMVVDIVKGASLRKKKR